MRNLFLSVVLFFLVACAQAGSIGQSGISGEGYPACASGYTRVAPHYCAAATPTLLSVTEGTCQAITGISGAKAYTVYLSADLRANNAFGWRYVNVQAFRDSGCTSLAIRLSAAGVEFTAQAGSPSLAKGATSGVVVPLTQGGSFYIKHDDDGTISYMNYAITGYYD